ncbi:C45 family autoproteolytic acyltransferase/hydolase [Roseivivax isoporae]|uniref:Peptidase C45 hydrolase domain-containing protein n=1 Tax=Roseivivax isoporae LMG 25204 TaxID=1449351 RepID=X7FAE5_9RHOB|nr:C45 family peptidase [Roseivivax isoporae]ETX29056.1 hypothetical protein RISW2_03685 [Roseivivax isoporae LMG 25204]
MIPEMHFDAVAEARPGRAWQARWQRSGALYLDWFTARGGLAGPSGAECAEALAHHMPELVPVHRALTRLAGGSDNVGRFLSGWCPPPYLGGCSLAAFESGGTTRLVRNYDLSPTLNEGLLLRTEWTGTPVMAMTEFLWGVSDGINGHGLAVALAFGGTRTVGRGFGICMILRYVLETCRDVTEARAVLDRVPSHMDYNVVLADAGGRTASVEMHAGGGTTWRATAIATNHQLDAPLPDRAAFTRTVERRARLSHLVAPGQVADASAFLVPPLYQTDYAGGFGTLFTAEYVPRDRAMRLMWPDGEMVQSLDAFFPESWHVRFAQGAASQGTPVPATDMAAMIEGLLPNVPAANREAARHWIDAAAAGRVDWAGFGQLFVPPAMHEGGAR